MYSFEPIVAESHTVGPIVFGVASLAMARMSWQVEMRFMSIGFMMATILCWFISTIEPRQYANTPVEAHFIKFEPVMKQVTSGGKVTTTKEVIEMYIVFLVDDQMVSLLGQVGKPYPQILTLYKN